MMGFARQILLAVLALSVAAYASDCGGMTTPEQAMQCCNSMQCSSHHHHRGQECCKTMTAMHAALGHPSSVQGVSFSPIALGLVRAFNESQSIEHSTSTIAEHSHSPPISSSPPALPLRI
jgi:hypothetical protein